MRLQFAGGSLVQISMAMLDFIDEGPASDPFLDPKQGPNKYFFSNRQQYKLWPIFASINIANYFPYTM